MSDDLSAGWPVVGEDTPCVPGETLDADTIEALRRNRPPMHIHIRADPLSDEDLRTLLNRLRAL